MNLRKIYRKVFAAKTLIDFPGSYIPVQYILDGVGDDKNIAVSLGDLIGRDYVALGDVFDSVKVIDINDNGVIPPEDLLLQDASKPTDIEAGSIDYAVICNVLEHMYGDMSCLIEMNRILGPNGRLFIDTPYFSDAPFFHYRIYSPRIFKRMLEKAGFEIITSSYRGVVININNNVFGAITLAMYPFFGKNTLKYANKFFYGLNKLLGKSYYINRLSRNHFGAYVLCKKVGEPIDELQVQIKHFGQVKSENA